MSRRPIGLNGAGEVRLVVFLPGMPVGTAFRRNGVGGVVQPGMPLRRHAAGLDLAFVGHPAPLAAQRILVRTSATLGAVVAVPLPVVPDQLRTDKHTSD